MRCITGPIIDRNEDGSAVDPAAEQRARAQHAYKQVTAKPIKRRHPGLVDLTKETPRQTISRITRKATVSLIDPVTDKLRKEKFSGNWVDPS